MRLWLAFLMLASAASAQTPDSVAVRRPLSGVRADLVLAGIAVGATAVVVGRAVAQGAGVSSEARDWAFALYPVGVAAGVHALARQQGFEGSLGGAARRTAAGTLVGLAGGYGLVYLAFEVSGGLFSNDNEAAATALLFAGIGTVLVVPAVAAAGEYRVPEATPVVLRGPGGERVSGLALRIAL